MANQVESLRDLRSRKKAAEAQQKVIDQVAPGLPETSQSNSDSNADLLVGTEMVAEAVEQGNTELRQIAQNTGEIKDVVAAGELVAEETSVSNQHLANIASGTREAVVKLSAFAERLKSSFGQSDESGTSPDIAPVVASSDSAARIVNDDVPTPENPMLNYLKTISDNMEKVLAKAEKQETEDKKPESKPVNEEDVTTIIDRLGDRIIKSVDSGFKKSINVADSIASMLFKYSITAALNAAKMAALILSVIIAVDVLMRHIQHWTQMFQDNYAEFKEQLGAFATPFENIHSVITDLVNYFKSDEYLKMFERLAKGAFDQMTYIVDMMMLGLAKLGATILRALGFNDQADTIESAALTRASSNSGYVMSENEKEVVGRVEKRNAEEAAKESEVSWWEGKKREWDGKEKETPEERDRRVKRENIAANTTTQQFGEFKNFQTQIAHVGETARKNETSPELLAKHKELLAVRTKEVEVAHKSGKLTDDAYKQLQVDIQEQSKLMDAKGQSISARAKTEVVKAAPSEDVARVNQVEQEERRVEAARESRRAEATQINTQANVVNTNNQTYVQAPRTSSPGPGIGNHL
ncbi:baseplate hub subunit and tail length [Aeromonas phage GomatiRiver_11]|nr:hypothetical protein OBDJBBDK_00265 [Aeromonas phage AhFM11]WKW84431.1 baseplate hub subunit and tail length [Aeromonas phage GomatiRiver_11]